MEKIYCGKGKKSQYGIKINLCLSKIPDEFVTEYNGQKYIRLDLSELRQVDDRGNTHTVKIDTWKPQGQAQNTPPQSTPPDDSTLPF